MEIEDNTDEDFEPTGVADTGDTSDAVDIPAGDGDGVADLPIDAGDNSGDDAAPAEGLDSTDRGEKPAEEKPTDGLNDSDPDDDTDNDEATRDADAPAEPPRFMGSPCTDDCSGHEAGYQWAEEKGIADPDDCSGNSNSFVEGCRAYAEE